MPPAMRLAIAHEWVQARAGSEKTFEALAQLFPNADLFALTVNKHIDLNVGNRSIQTTALDRMPVLRSHRSVSLPLMPAAWRYATKREFDVVISSSHACSKGFRPARAAVHLCYCHTPMRYAWEADLDRRMRLPALLASPMKGALRRWDRRSARWVDSFAANSYEVRDRIRRHYGRDAVVIPPPVDTEFFTPSTQRRGEYLLAVSRWIPYKRLDLAICVAAKVHIPLVIAGEGPLGSPLRKLADKVHPGGVTFVQAPTDEDLRDLYRFALALVFPAHEDFGIIPVESQSCGTPVVGLAAGGILDSVKDGSTGVLVPNQSVEALAEGVRAAIALGDVSKACREQAAYFSRSRFEARVTDWCRSNGLML